jgi:hypothetical protein
MFRLIWKQQWKQFLYGFILIALYVGYILYESMNLPQGNGAYVSQDALNIVRGGQAIPILLGMFWGAPLLSSEYENNTTKFIWTQGISRGKWLRTKLGLTTAIAGFYGLICTLVTTWWFDLQVGGLPVAGHFESAQFGLTGFMPIVYAMFAVAMGAALGAWLRKPVPAIAITLMLYAAIQYLFISGLRPHYMPLVSYTYKPSRGCVTTVNKDDASVNCSYTDFGPKTLTNETAWVLGYTHTENGGVIYQPGYRYWDFQDIEAVLYLGMTAITMLATYQMVLKRNI